MKIITSTIFNFSKKPMVVALVFWTTICMALLVYSATKQYILPKYFFFDENTISMFIQWSAKFIPGDSYSSTAAFYTLLGIDKESLLFTMTATVITIALYYYHLVKAKTKSLTAVEIILLVFFMLLSVTYMSTLSKEFIVAIVLTPFVFFARRGFWGLATWCIIALLYAAYFRTYWFIIIPLTLSLYYIFRSTTKSLYLILFVPLALLFLSLAFSIFLGLDLDGFRTNVNDIRIDAGDTNARTIILPWISGGGVITSWLNSSITWVTLMIPLPLFILPSPYYLLIATLITILFYKSWRAFFEILSDKSQPDLAASAALIISFTAVQSIFEPDYGSYAKHLAPLYPLFFYVILKSRHTLKNKRIKAIA